MINSEVVLNGQAIAYTIYAIVIILFIAVFAYRLTRPGKAGVLKTSLFVVLVAGLTVLGVSLHIATTKTIPWVELDLKRHSITPDHTFNVVVEDHTFKFEDEKLVAKVGEIVLFEVVSNDLTYGFGIFRQDNSMVCQMQVVPGSRNDLMWRFEKPGIYNVRSTEYSGPKGHNMIVKNIIEITE
jgi:cytochrome c oxidase subunit 2